MGNQEEAFKYITPYKTSVLTLEEAQSGQGQEIMKGKVNDPNWDGWQKTQHSHQLPSGNNITIHYWHNPENNVNTGFKFKTPPRY